MAVERLCVVMSMGSKLEVVWEVHPQWGWRHRRERNIGTKGRVELMQQLAVLGYQHMTLKEPSLMGLNGYSEESLSRR
jgi:hypothetical protein